MGFDNSVDAFGEHGRVLQFRTEEFFGENGSGNLKHTA